jgi:hypothetical protein
LRPRRLSSLCAFAEFFASNQRLVRFYLDDPVGPG